MHSRFLYSHWTWALWSRYHHILVYTWFHSLNATMSNPSCSSWMHSLYRLFSLGSPSTFCCSALGLQCSWAQLMKKPESFSSAVIFTSALSYQLKISPDSGRKRSYRWHISPTDLIEDVLIELVSAAFHTEMHSLLIEFHGCLKPATQPMRIWKITAGWWVSTKLR